MDGSSNASTKDTAGGSSDTASTSYQPFPEMSAEQEFFLYELETTDSGSIGLVLRAIYDCGDVNKFSRALEHRIHQYDKNIQKVCSFHYQGFVDSMKQLLHLKERCQDIKQDALSIDAQVQSASEDISKKSQEIVKYRKLMKNASTAMDQISVCLPVLENYSKLQELMYQKKYYQALKVLEELEHTHLALVEKYRFTQILAKSMAPVRTEIKDKAYSEFKDFLENIKKVAGRVGRDASKDIAEQHSFGGADAEKTRRLQEDSRKSAVNTDIQLSADGSLVKKNTSNNRRMAPTDSMESEDDHLSAQFNIEYTPVHRCCQIFTVLGAKEEFEAYYRAQRKEQCELAIEPPAKMNTLKHYVDYLDEIVGFFVVEDHIMMTEPSLATAAHKDQLWENALKKVVHTTNTRFGGSIDIEMMLRMKKVIQVFALTMKSYSYTIGPIYTLLQNFRDQYNEILMREYCSQFERDLEHDNYTPITVKNEEEFRRVVNKFPFYKRSTEQEPFPRKLPYSMFVVSVYGQAQTYLRGCYEFMEHLQLTQSEIDDTVRRYANMLLARWSGSLKSYVNKKLSLIQLVQITVNIGYLERSCQSLGNFITKLTSGGEEVTSTGHQITLSDKVFRDARSEVEQQIDEHIQDKVNEVLELSQYDWELPASSGVASDHISDLINFLSTTFTSFTNLPSVLAKHVCMQTCKHLAQQLSESILDSSVRAVSPGALDQFSLDVMQCEMFTARCPVPGFDHQTLPMTFAHLRQLLDLVMSADWTTYLAEYGQETGKYVRVKASTAIILLDKMVEFEKKSTGFFGLGRGDRKKLLDTILRQLKNLANQ